MKLTRDIQSLTEFKRNTSGAVRTLSATGSPMVLTVNGRAKLVVQDADAYQRLLDQLDHQDAVKNVRRGIAEVDAGKTRSFAEFDEEFRRRNRIRGRR